jgi:hypothetical protein
LNKSIATIKRYLKEPEEYGLKLSADNKINNLYLLSPFSETKDYLSYFKNQNMRGGKILLKPFIRITAEDYLLKISNVEKIKNYYGITVTKLNLLELYLELLEEKDITA